MTRTLAVSLVAALAAVSLTGCDDAAEQQTALTDQTFAPADGGLDGGGGPASDAEAMPDSSPTPGDSEAPDTEARDAGMPDADAPDVDVPPAWEGWCGFRFEPEQPLLCEANTLFGGSTGAGPRAPLPVAGQTLVLTPRDDQTWAIGTEPGGEFRDEPGTGTLQSARMFHGLAGLVSHGGLTSSASFDLLGAGYHAFGAPVGRISVSADGVLVFGGSEDKVDLPLDEVARLSKLRRMPAPYLVYLFTDMRVNEGAGGTEAFWVDEFDDRVVLSIAGLPYFHNPDCDLDPCHVRVQLRWFVDGHLEIHYDVVDPTHFVAMALGLGAHAGSCPDLPMPCRGWFPIE